MKVMVDIQSATAEIRRGKKDERKEKKEEERRRKNKKKSHNENIAYWPHLLCRVAITNRKSYKSFRFVPKSVTLKLNDLEQRNGLYFALFHRIR